MKRHPLYDFVAESNRIENIHRPPTPDELHATEIFSRLDDISTVDVCSLVDVFAPGHRLRDNFGLDVRVGNYVAPPGGPEIRDRLRDLIREINRYRISPHEAHVRYESLHPFTDGNGRSGRAIWLWQMRGKAPRGFLHEFYYQALEAADSARRLKSQGVASS